jgi:hypothetical protein
MTITTDLLNNYIGGSWTPAWREGLLARLGPDAVEFFTKKKTVTSRWFSDGQGSGAYFVER